MLDQYHMRFQKLLIGIRYVSAIGRIILLDNHLQLLQLDNCVCRCISKYDSDDSKGRLILVEVFLEHFGWFWDRGNLWISTVRFIWCIIWS